MTKLHIIAISTALGISTALFVQSAAAADAANSGRLAERWCAACHVVTTTQREAYSDAPPFEEIAKRPGFTESGITTFLLDPHGKMPNMDLSRTEAADIAAYISRQR
jgi:mono/diheme cytochrome c family protein